MKPQLLLAKLAVTLHALALTGCVSAVTIHRLPSEYATPAPAGLSGVWIGDDHEDAIAIEFHAKGDGTPEDPPESCGQAQLTYVWSTGMTTALTTTQFEDTSPNTDELCFYDIGGHLVAELAVGHGSIGLPVYHHLLIRAAEDELQVCGADVWALFLVGEIDSGWAKVETPFTDARRAHPSWKAELKYHAWDGGADSHFVVVLAESAELARYLSRHLPELSKVCDEAGDKGWSRLRRMGSDGQPEH
jgi:hypothetical protein